MNATSSFRGMNTGAGYPVSHGIEEYKKGQRQLAWTPAQFDS